MVMSLKRVSGLVMVVALGVMGSLPLPGTVSAEIRPAYVRDVDNGAWQPFSVCGTDADTYHLIYGFLLTVPAGKKAVIEYISCRASTETSVRYVYVDIFDGSTSTVLGKHFLAVTRQGAAGGRDDFVGGSPVKLYADPGTEVRWWAYREPNYTLQFSGEICISGHYVDITQ